MKAVSVGQCPKFSLVEQTDDLLLKTGTNRQHHACCARTNEFAMLWVGVPEMFTRASSASRLNVSKLKNFRRRLPGAWREKVRARVDAGQSPEEVSDRGRIVLQGAQALLHLC